ncbi:TauD/TfdA family dioxygenase [Aurantiacibacter sp. MUD11]|uniref:TauD/TfdA dioxygenase family protein n=1 Tax=Aurantiacibacter sp. MUD11 TaxID=3003265 RepID=UPI0022AA961D|nr:TauD/TfdA family dioxygenase [Aurantiacibacter sp. MUD11]WAT16819.1 TauD/TfdA family dioxygenase [Aurantiacibacter sp. MUD11]
MQTRKLADNLGLEIAGLDTTAPLSRAQLDELASLFHEHLALVIRSPVLTPHQYVAFIRQLGEPDGSDTSRYHEPIDVDGFKGLRLVSNIEKDGRNVGQFGADEMGWHQDRWTDAAPPPATALHGVEVTKAGGRTGIASLAAAYDALPPELLARIAGRHIHFPLQVNDFEGALDEADIEDESLFRKVPLVQRHAVTGRKFLFLGARKILEYIDTAPRITGLDKQESADLLDAIYEHVARPEFAYLHQWQAGDILIWDNRTCAHRRESFDPDERRLLYGTPLVSSDLLWNGKAALAA